MTPKEFTKIFFGFLFAAGVVVLVVCRLAYRSVYSEEAVEERRIQLEQQISNVRDLCEKIDDLPPTAGAFYRWLGPQVYDKKSRTAVLSCLYERTERMSGVGTDLQYLQYRRDPL